MRTTFTGRSFAYRLILGAVILAVVIPVWVSGHKPMWPVSVVTILIVTAVGILLARQARVRAWLRRD
jgi:uncharacterized membrane protein